MAALSDQELFRLGFLTRCAEERLTGPALQTRIKSAGWPLALAALSTIGGMGLASANRSGSALGFAPGAVKGYGTLLGLAGAAGGLGGAGLGYGLAKATDPEISDEEIRNQELAETYRVYAQRARDKRLKKRKEYRPAS